MKIFCITEIDLWVSRSVSYPHFCEGERDLVVVEVVHEFELREGDEAFKGQYLEILEYGGGVGTVCGFGDDSDGFLLLELEFGE